MLFNYSAVGNSKYVPLPDELSGNYDNFVRKTLFTVLSVELKVAFMKSASSSDY